MKRPPASGTDRAAEICALDDALNPLAQMDLTEECFEQMTRMLVQAAQRHCGGRIVSALEGGYDLRAIGRSVVRHLRGLHSG